MKKKDLTSYWGIELDIELFNNPVILKELKERSHLVHNNKIHSTLLFVGKKVDDREDVFKQIEGKECYLTIDRYGITDDAMALGVKELKFVDDILSDVKVPSYATVQHITMALNKDKNILAKDSIKSFEQAENVKVINIITKGIIKRYLY
jgi:2'-5' RNA ligase